MFNKLGITPSKFMGFMVFLIFAVGSMIISQTAGTPATAQSRNVAAALRAPHQYIEDLNRTDRIWLGEQIRNDLCYDITKVQTKPCPRKNWPNGDNNFNWNPYYNRIPKNTKVLVDIRCDEKEGRFYTNVKLLDVCPKICGKKNGRQVCRNQTKNCGDTWFKSPYDPDGKGPFSETPTRWLTSPGKFNEMDFTHFKGIQGKYDSQVSMGDTSGTIPFGTSIAVNELYFVQGGRAQGAQLTNAILADPRNGIFIHGVNDRGDANGLGQSLGCVRLYKNDQKALFDLARRVGTRNMQFQFGGYGSADPKLGGQPACSASSDAVLASANRGHYRGPRAITENQRQQRAQRSQRGRNFFQRFFSLFRRKKPSPTEPSDIEL